MSYSTPPEPPEEYPSPVPGAEPLEEEQLPRRVTVRLPQRTPYVVYGILGLTILVYLVQYFSGQELLFAGVRCPYFFSPDLPACYGLKVNEFILTGQYWRLLAPILLHGSLLHIGFNMYALYILGPELENHFGHLPFLALYVISGFAGFVASFLLTPSPSLGASTAVFGLLAAQGMFAYRNRRVFGPRASAALRSILSIALINFIIGLSPGIDNWGHLGGALGGLLFAAIAVPDYHIAGEEGDYVLSDQNPPGRAVSASFIVGAIFFLLAAGYIFWRALL